MKKIESKLERISRLEGLLLSHPAGLLQTELARCLNVHRSTVCRYLADLEGIIPVYEEDGRLMINRDHYLSNVKLTVHEIMVLHLAARLFCHSTDKHNPHACSVVRKLGNCLHPYSQRMSDFLLATASAMERQSNVPDKNYIGILEKLTRAWSDGCWLRISYFSHKTDTIHEYDFAPWFVQPYEAGRTVYTVGFCREKNHQITLKVERIREAELLKEKYDIPVSFDAEALFADAWGIWYADTAPVEVVLRFSAKVADRVSETIWHRSQKVERTPEGVVVLRVNIAEPLEMLPWIRGWGSDCEVLEPASLRMLMREEAVKMGRLYA